MESSKLKAPKKRNPVASHSRSKSGAGAHENATYNSTKGRIRKTKHKGDNND